MFGWFRKKSAPASQQPSTGPLITALLIDRDTFPMEHLRDRLSKEPIQGRMATGFREDNGFLVFELGEEMGAIAPMPVPYPWSDLKGPCETAWMWPNGTSPKSLESHRKHVLVTLMGGKGDHITRRLAVTQLTAMASEEPGVVGVYWPEGTAVHHPDVFRQIGQASSAELPPLFLWVDVRVFTNADGSSGAFTTGLAALGAMDFEVPSIHMPPGELREWAFDIACYLAVERKVIKDGDTIGMTASQQMKVRHVPSSFGGKNTVLRFQG